MSTPPPPMPPPPRGSTPLADLGTTSGGPARSKPNLLWLWVALGAVVVLIAGFAVLTVGGDEGDDEVTVGTVDDDSGASDDTDGSDASAPTEPSGSAPADTTEPTGTGQFAETWPVTVSSALVDLPSSGPDPAVGQPAPTLSGFSFDGTPITVDPSKGPVLLVFLAHWCPHCNREVPELNAWRDSGEVPADLQVIAVTTAVTPGQAHYPPSTWIYDEMGWTWPVLADSPTNDAALAFGVSGFPFSAIIGTDGTVLARTSGELGRDGIAEFVASALG